MHFEIGSRVKSSHMPLHLSIAKRKIQEEKEERSTKSEGSTKVRWNREKAQEYENNINSEDTKTRLQEAFELLDVSTEYALKKFSDILVTGL